MAKKRILIVDDDKLISEMYATKFQAEGYEVAAAYDGESVIGKIAEFKPGVVLLDLVMYPMDGFSVLEAIRRLPPGGRPAVIIISNLGQKEDIEKGMHLGASDYVIKAHFTPSQVLEKVEHILNPDQYRGIIAKRP